MRKLLFAAMLLSAFLQSCKDDKVPPVGDPPPNMVRITMQPEFNGQELLLDQTYTTNEGYLVQFIELKCILEDIRNGDNVLIDAGLFDYKANGTALIETEGDAKNFDSLTCNLGVKHTLNHSDPTLFPTTSALNIINANDMHWDWNPGYIFVKVEARVDTIPDATELFDHTVVFHVGGDVNLQTLSFNNINWIDLGNNLSHLPLRLDMATFLDNGTQSIDLKTEYISHTGPGQEAISLKVMEQFAAAISIY